MESKDIEISKEIGQCLYSIAPEDTKIILMIAALSPEGDVSQFEFYSNNGIHESEFSISDTDTMKLHYLAKAISLYISQPSPSRSARNVSAAA